MVRTNIIITCFYISTIYSIVGKKNYIENSCASHIRYVKLGELCNSYSSMVSK